VRDQTKQIKKDIGPKVNKPCCIRPEYERECGGDRTVLGNIPVKKQSWLNRKKYFFIAVLQKQSAGSQEDSMSRPACVIYQLFI
jgi:hypothetical protein